MTNKSITMMSTTLLIALAFVYYYLEYIPEVDPNYQNAPVNGLQVSSVSEVLPLTLSVENPAGISFNPDNGTYLVSTDDQVFAEVSADFSKILSSITIDNSPFSPGDTEGVAYLGDDSAATVGENGVVILLKRDSQGVWAETARFVIENFKQGTQLGSAAYSKDTNTLYTAQKKGEDKVLYSINLDSQQVKVIPLKLGAGLTEKAGRSWGEFYIAGLDYHDGVLIAVSEPFSSILTIQLDGSIVKINGVEGLAESSGITLSNENYYLIGDAENYLPDPPVYLIKNL